MTSSSTKTPGATLDQPAAREIAERYLKDHQVDPARYQLVDAATEKLKHRTDHTFTWEEKDWRIRDARARLFIAIRGDQPSDFRRYLKLPESWQRDFLRLHLQRYLLPAVGGGIGLLLLVVFIQNLRRHPFRWKRYAAVGVPFCLLILAQFLNDKPGLWSDYNTAQPPQEFLADLAVSLIVRTLLAGFAAALAMLALEVFAGPRRFSNSPWILAPAMAVAFGAAMRLISWGEQFVPGNRFSLPLWSPPPVDQWSPALGVLLSAAISAVLIGLLGSILAAAAVGLFAPRKRLGYGLTIALALALSRSDSPALIAYNFVAILALLLLASLVVRTSGSAVAQLVAAVFGGQAILGAVKLVGQPNPALRTPGLSRPRLRPRPNRPLACYDAGSSGFFFSSSSRTITEWLDLSSSARISSRDRLSTGSSSGSGRSSSGHNFDRISAGRIDSRYSSAVPRSCSSSACSP